MTQTPNLQVLERGPPASRAAVFVTAAGRWTCGLKVILLQSYLRVV